MNEFWMQQTVGLIILAMCTGWLIKELVKKDKIIDAKDAVIKSLSDANIENLKEQITYNRAQEGQLTNTLKDLVSINEDMSDKMDELTDNLKL